MDDRFDFQLVTGEFLEGDGLSYLSGSYHAFGNNGSTYNSDINATSNSYVFNGVTSYSKPAILNALATVTDHLPVVADYQIPAIMQAVATMVPDTLRVGDAFDLNVMVSNSAKVVAAIGADELLYSLTVSGDLFGSYLNQMDLALGGGNTHSVRLATATPGMKSGQITITSPNQMVQNALITIPVNYEVLSADLLGDYNLSGVVDAADYVVWRDRLGEDVTPFMGADGDGSGIVDQADYQVWRTHFGHISSGNASSPSEVPEPSSGLLLLVIVLVGRSRRDQITSLRT
jgi:hypothetical protein